MHLIADKLQQYDTLTQNFLVHASCIGSEFSLKTLELIGHFPKDISRMINDGFLSPTDGSGDSFKFTHEHVKQAIFSLDPPENKKFIYFCIGHSLWKRSSDEELEENLFLVVNMLNLAQGQLETIEKKDVATLNLRAAEKCIKLTAFQIALDFLVAGMKLLDNENMWSIDYDLTLKHYQLAKKTFYSVMDCGKMMSYDDTLVKHAKSEYDTIPSCALQMW